MNKERLEKLRNIYVDTGHLTGAEFSELHLAARDGIEVREDAERWRAARRLFETNYELADGTEAIALFLRDELQLGPDSAIDAVRAK